MNKQGLNRILIIIMITIWIVVLYRLINYFSADNTVLPINNTVATIPQSFLKFSKDTFALSLVDRDPFLGKIYKRKPKRIRKPKQISKPNNKVNTSKKPVVKRKQFIHKWPNLKYFGYVKGANSTSELILIKVNNKLHKVREGDEVSEVIIRKVFKDSIRVQLGKEVKAIIKR